MSKSSSPNAEPPVLPLGCVIMASGLGKRFGGNKLLAELGGQPLIGWVLDATQGIFQRRVVVTRHTGVEALCRQRQVPVVLHHLPCRSDTVRLGLEAVGEEVSGCMFCPGDQPLLSQETVRAVALQAARDPEHIWRLGWEGTAGSPVIFPKRFFPQLRALPQGKGGSVVVQKNAGQVRVVPARDWCELWDVDRPEDLEKLSAQLER